MPDYRIAGFEFYEYSTGCHGMAGRVAVEFDWDAEVINFSGTEGSGYMEQSIRCNIPVEVIVEMVRRIGYTVTPNTSVAAIPLTQDRP